MALETTADLKQALNVIEQKDIELQLKKDSLATIISNKGVPTQGTDSFDTMINNVGNISTKPEIAGSYEGIAFLKDEVKNIVGFKHQENLYQAKPTYVDSPNNLVSDITASRGVVKDINNNIYMIHSAKRLLKFDSDMNQLFDITLPIYTYYTAVTKTNLYVLYQNNLYKIDFEGNIIKSEVLDQNYNSITTKTITQYENGEFFDYDLIVCTSLNSNGTITVLDSELQIFSSYIHPYIIKAIDIGMDGHLYLADNNGDLIKINPQTFDLVKSMKFVDSVTKLVVTDEFIVCRRGVFIYFCSIDMEGFYSWEERYSNFRDFYVDDHNMLYIFTYTNVIKRNIYGFSIWNVSYTNSWIDTGLVANNKVLSFSSTYWYSFEDTRRQAEKLAILE